MESHTHAPSVPPIEDIAGHYDSLDYYYRDIWGEHIHHGLWRAGNESPAEAADQMSRCVLERLEMRPGDLLLDVGCGYGATARIAAHAFGVKVIGFTISTAQKSFADRRAVSGGNVEIRLQDWAKAELPPESADAVLSLESIEHMPDRSQFLQRVRRTLRPGGRLVVCTWLAAENTSAWSRRHLLQPIATEGRQAPLVTAGELRSLLNNCGFQNVQVEDVTLRVRKTWRIVVRRMLLRMLTRRRYWQLLFNSSASDRIFAITSCRILMAYQVRCMQYAIFTCQ